MPAAKPVQPSKVALAQAVRTKAGDTRVSVAALDATPLGIALTQKKLEEAER